VGAFPQPAVVLSFETCHVSKGELLRVAPVIGSASRRRRVGGRQDVASWQQQSDTGVRGNSWQTSALHEVGTIHADRWVGRLKALARSRWVGRNRSHHFQPIEPTMAMPDHMARCQPCRVSQPPYAKPVSRTMADLCAW
jgi:hypothetical protein